MNKKKEIDFYGDSENYIHLKFGDCRKMYFFTKEFIAKYPDFAREYKNYFEGNKVKHIGFSTAFAVVSYVYNHKIPVHFYYNFTDTPAESKEEIMAYLVNENSFVGDLTK